MNEESLEKYEGIIDENGLIDYDSLLDVIQQKKELEKDIERLRKGLRTLFEYLDAIITYEDEEILLGIKGALKVLIE